MPNIITAEVEVNLPVEKVWKLWNTPEDVMQWNNASDDWHNLSVNNDAITNGKFLFKMAKKDGSEHFDFGGAYDEVITNKLMSYTLDDGRKTTITFSGNNPVKITEAFEPEKSLSADMQRNFCQLVLNCFKSYAEAKG